MLNEKVGMTTKVGVGGSVGLHWASEDSTVVVRQTSGDYGR